MRKGIEGLGGEYDTEDQMAELVVAMQGKRLPHAELIAFSGLSLGAHQIRDDDRPVFDIT